MFAQEQDSLRTKSIDDVVITGNANPKASIKTSTSISTLKMKEIINAAPRTTAEIFRTIPEFVQNLLVVKETLTLR